MPSKEFISRDTLLCTTLLVAQAINSGCEAWKAAFAHLWWTPATWTELTRFRRQTLLDFTYTETCFQKMVQALVGALAGESNMLVSMGSSLRVSERTPLLPTAEGTGRSSN